MDQIIVRIKKYSFMFEELVKRDFKQKYKRTVFGAGWSVLNPLLTLLIMRVVFTQFFGRNIEHYTIYLFCGTLVFAYYRESTHTGMNSLFLNAHIFSKINVPKYMFLLSKNVSSFINFSLTLLVFLLFCAIDHIHFGFHLLMLIFPVLCLTVFNIGVGLVLSALFMFFRDIGYIYEVFLTLLNYVSAIFYSVDNYPETIQRLFYLNPVYCYIKYFRTVVINGSIPSFKYHLLCVFYALFFAVLGGWIYKKNNQKFLYYI